MELLLHPSIRLGMQQWPRTAMALRLREEEPQARTRLSQIRRLHSIRTRVEAELLLQVEAIVQWMLHHRGLLVTPQRLLSMPVVRRRKPIGLKQWRAAICSMEIGSEMTHTLSIPRDHVLTSMSPSTARSMAALIMLTRGSGGSPADAAFQGELRLLEQLCFIQFLVFHVTQLKIQFHDVHNRLNPSDMLERLRGKRLVFVGDSLNRNMWESLVCILRNSVKDKRKVFEVSGRQQFRAEGSYSFLFQVYCAFQSCLMLCICANFSIRNECSFANFLLSRTTTAAWSSSAPLSLFRNGSSPSGRV
ncbi:Os02g0773732 [Oryza sativa Japonica Group]|jgi:hypothetical protein|uniref:Os02g0773732 protein n=1 Tax=Oryza sativa subsp. japonica TaxID=39947 RepID=C7IZ47_ORYSJ|nr:Os02g0773732 [Oryza sativa Japonica Group]|eukprot:NP_001173164.1 Os02g0773732 [Oryza sativa Japonica Group]